MFNLNLFQQVYNQYSILYISGYQDFEKGSFNIRRLSAKVNQDSLNNEIFEDLVHSDAHFNALLPLGQLGRDYIGGGWNFIRYLIRHSRLQWILIKGPVPGKRQLGHDRGPLWGS